MTLQITKLKDCYEVKETVHGWYKDTHTYYYFNLEQRRRSSSGKKNAPLDTHMSDSDVHWAEQYYIPLSKEKEARHG